MWYISLTEAIGAVRRFFKAYFCHRIKNKILLICIFFSADMEDIVIVEFHGFKDNYDKFVVKELYILTENRSDSWVFLPPYEEERLTHAKRREVAWCTNNVHGFCWNDGGTPYEYFEAQLVECCEGYKKIFTKGLEKARFLQNILKKPVYDVSEILKVKFDALPDPGVVCLYEHDRFSCAKRNAHKLFIWIENIRKVLLE